MELIDKFIHRKYWLIVGLMVIWGMLLRLPSHFEPLWYDDEAITLTVGQSLGKGNVLYRDIIDHKTPFLYWMATLLPRLEWFKMGGSLVMMGIIIGYGIVVKQVIGHWRRGAIWAMAGLGLFTTAINLPSLEGNLVNGEVLMSLFSLAGWAVFWVYYIGRKSRIGLLISGVLFGCALMSKVPSAVELVVAGLVIWGMPDKSWLGKLKRSLVDGMFLVMGVGLIVGLVSAWFAHQGALAEFIQWAVLYNFGYMEAWSAEVEQRAMLSGTTARGLVAVVVSLGVAVARMNLRIKFAIWWFVWSLFGALLSERPYPHYLIQVLAPTSLLVAMAFVVKVKHSVVIVLMISLLWIVQLEYKFSRYALLPYYQNFRDWYANKLDNAEFYNNFDRRAWDQYQAANYIKATGSKDGEVWVYSDQPRIYVLSGMSPVTRTITAYHIVDFGLEEETLDKLIIEKPQLVVWGPVNLKVEKIEAWIEGNYSKAVEFGEFEIWKKI